MRMTQFTWVWAYLSNQVIIDLPKVISRDVPNSGIRPIAEYQIFGLGKFWGPNIRYSTEYSALFRGRPNTWNPEYSASACDRIPNIRYSATIWPNIRYISNNYMHIQMLVIVYFVVEHTVYAIYDLIPYLSNPRLSALEDCERKLHIQDWQ